MQMDLIVSVAMFGAASFLTPGPNNVMLAASGVNFGFRRTVPHMMGVNFGFALMTLAVGLGLGGVFLHYPMAHVILKYVCVFYLVYLAWKIARAGESKGPSAQSHPLTFFQAAAFQWVNPKAWAIAIGAVATFTSLDGDLTVEVLSIALIFLLVSFPSTSTWTAFGTVIGRYLRKPQHLRMFNWLMAGLLVASLIPALL